MNNKSEPEIIETPNLLLDRVSKNDKAETDFSAADEVIYALAKEFVQRLPDEFTRIETALAALETTPDDETCNSELFRLVHDLKGQAGTFDYILISVIGNDLCRYIERPIAMTPRRLKVLRFHVDAMKRVAEDKMTGDQHEHGLRMINTLHSMTQKVLQED
ncbi:MAG: Hpt domain-containing protein [Rhodospirillales bacterium]|nr:Hpt domain-containing protein [Rhodospirillales bacterium]